MSKHLRFYTTYFLLLWQNTMMKASYRRTSLPWLIVSYNGKDSMAVGARCGSWSWKLRAHIWNCKEKVERVRQKEMERQK